MLNNRDFGANIADLRKKKGLTQAQLAEMLNISNKTISRWETGEGYPEVTLLSPLAKALGITVDELLAESAPEPDQSDQPENNEYVDDTENRKSKVKKHKDIPVEWPQIQLRGFFKRSTVIVNVLQMLFFTVFTIAIMSCNDYTYYSPAYVKDNNPSAGEAAFICTDKIGYVILGGMVVCFIALTAFYVLFFRLGKLGKALTARNIAVSAAFVMGAIISYSPLNGHIWLGNSVTIYEPENPNFFICDYFKVNRQLIFALFCGLMVIYFISEMIRIRCLRKDGKVCPEITANRITFWKSLTVFNKIGVVCIIACMIFPFLAVGITIIAQSITIPVTDSIAFVTPAVLLTFISIFPKVGLVTAALGLILGACDLYDRQYKASIIIIGANLILPYIMGFITVVLFMYPYQALFN